MFNKFSLSVGSLIILIWIMNANALGPIPTASSQHPVKPRTLPKNRLFTPTNSWYENWLVGSGENPIHTYPYILKATGKGLTICYPSQMVTNQQAYVLEVINANLLFSVRESFDGPRIDESTISDDQFYLGARLNFGSKFYFNVVRGGASLIAHINSATPVLTTIHAIIAKQAINDRTYKISLNNGQTWLFQSENVISWQTSSTEIYSSSVYSGWLKISIATGNEAEQALLKAQTLLISNGRVSYQVDRNSNQVKVRVDYDSSGLYYILPHVINPTGTSNINGATAKGIKGSYALSNGFGYQYSIPVFESSFVKSSILNSPDKISKLKDALKNDVNLKITSKDPYFGGKELARTAQLIEIADLVGDQVSKQAAKNVLVNELDSFWFSKSNSALVYEPTWGGIVSKKSVGSAETDFGIYYYNDHHFHFGYFINAAATLAKHYPDYYNSKSEYFNLLLADYAGTCTYQELPCRPRAKDPFLGHSYASGLFEFADSRNQESTSEAINSYLAVRELGKALNNQTLRDLGDYLLSTEIVATKVYWQIKSNQSIYPQPYAKNGVVGILWETKVDYATWFGGNVEFIYGIQMLPFNDITSQYLDREWLTQTRPIWSVAIDKSSTEEGWVGFLLLADSIVDPNRSGLSEKIHNLKSYDNGNTRTNTLWFYYMMQGSSSGDSSTSPVINISISSTKPTSVVITTSKCNGAQCLTTDNGRPDPNCGQGFLGCHSLSGALIGCYEPTTGNCFYGGSICPKPLLACFNLASPIAFAPCYDPQQYKCNNGNLVFIG